MFPTSKDLQCPESLKRNHGKSSPLARLCLFQHSLYFVVCVCRYSFEYGSVTVIMMSTEHIFQKSSKQLSALDKYLSAVDRTRTPWLIFSGHRLESSVCV